MLGVTGSDNVAELHSGYEISCQINVSCLSYLVLGSDILLKLLNKFKPGCKSGVKRITLELVDF